MNENVSNLSVAMMTIVNLIGVACFVSTVHILLGA